MKGRLQPLERELKSLEREVPLLPASNVASRVIRGPTVTGSVVSKITCYTCGEEGNKSPQCPKNLKSDKVSSREGKTKPVKRIWRSQSNCVQLEGVVNGQKAQVLLDSGAAISVVPEDMVAPNQMSGKNVAVRPFGAKTPMLLPTAEIAFQIGELNRVESVAVAPMLEGAESEVLCSLDLQSKRGLELVLLANGVEQKEVLRVTTRAQAKADGQEEEEEVAAVAKDKPKTKPLVVIEPNGQDVINEPREEEESEVSVQEVLCRQDEEFGKNLCILEDASEEEEEELYRMREESEGGVDIVIPPVKPVRHSRVHLIEETKTDPSLQPWRELATKKERGLVWRDGLMFQSVTTQVLESAFVLVLPKSFRTKVLGLAHDNLGHMGARRVKAILKARFSWPGMGQDVVDYCRSCPSCQTCAKNPARKVPLMERKVMSEPFEVMGFDIVGPMPKGRGGCMYLLTAICTATRWPEAIPLRSISARSVAVGMLEIFSRTGIPLQLVTDQGTQFVGAVMKNLCSSLHIDKIKTTPYHPEGNGVVERMHGTLGAMLTKAAKAGQDWVGQIPFALFALRAAPNRDTQYSTFELVYGRRIRTPLDIVHQGWAELEFEQLNVEEWAQWLVEKLEVWHDVMRNRGEEASRKRKIGFDKKTVNRELEEGDMVLCRIPGMTPKLEEAWHGPYPVIGKLNRVDYKVDVGKGQHKVLHINKLKKYWVREAEIMRIVVVAEDFDEEEAIGTKVAGRCLEFREEHVKELQKEFPDVFDSKPGRTGVCKLVIQTGEAPPIASMPYRVPDKLKEGVKQEVEKLVELGVVVASTSPWASPIVPVPKQDGALRLCIDYRKLNSITQPDPYYMVTLDEILERVGGSKCVSKIDLCKGFYQIEVEEESVAKTAFVTPFGKFEFKRMPFGLRNAPSIFQRTMEIVLRVLQLGSTLYRRYSCVLCQWRGTWEASEASVGSIEREWINSKH